MSDDNITYISAFTKSDVPVETVLSGAVEEELTQAIIIGWKEDGDLYIASSTGKLTDLLLLVKLAESDIIRSFDND